MARAVTKVIGRSTRHWAWIGLGGNIGDVPQTLIRARAAISELAQPPDRTLVSSPLYVSQPWGVPDQPAFINQVVGLDPAMGPEETLERLLAIERSLGRKRGRRWGPRNLDLDLLCWSDLTLEEPHLQLPHPRIAERRFVLQPWADIAPELVVPGLGTTVEQLLDRCPDSGWLQRLLSSEVHEG